MSGLRYNSGKPRWSLLPWDALAAVLNVMELGATKYAPRNWEKGLSWEQTYDALMRHLQAWYARNDRDEEWNQLHLAHAAWNVLVLLAFQLRGAGTDDRPKGHHGREVTNADNAGEGSGEEGGGEVSTANDGSRRVTHPDPFASLPPAHGGQVGVLSNGPVTSRSGEDLKVP